MALPNTVSSPSFKSTLPYLSAFKRKHLHLPATYRSNNRRSCRLLSFRYSPSSFSEKHHNVNPPKSDDLVELPLFPLPLVLFPGATIPLQILEFRYRVMMQTLLQTDLRFSDAVSGSAVGIGCVGENLKHECLVDDRYFLICKVQERFRVTDLVRTKPYLVAKVTWLEYRPSGEENLDELANELEGLMKEVIRLSNRLIEKPEKESQDMRKRISVFRFHDLDVGCSIGWSLDVQFHDLGI